MGLLSETQIKAAKPGPKEFFLNDGDKSSISLSAMWDADVRVRAITWMIAALNTAEPVILELVTARVLEGGYQARLPPAAPTLRSPGRCRLA